MGGETSLVVEDAMIEAYLPVFHENIKNCIQ